MTSQDKFCSIYNVFSQSLGFATVRSILAGEELFISIVQGSILTHGLEKGKFSVPFLATTNTYPLDNVLKLIQLTIQRYTRYLTGWKKCNAVISIIFVGINFEHLEWRKSRYSLTFYLCFDTLPITSLLKYALHWEMNFVGWWYQRKPRKLVFNEKKLIHSISKRYSSSYFVKCRQ